MAGTGSEAGSAGAVEPDDPLATIKLILEGSVDGAVIIGPDRRILYSNPAYRQHTGMSGRALRQAQQRGAECHECFQLEICATACLARRAHAARRALRLDEIAAIPSEGGDDLTVIVTAVPLPGGLTIETYRDVTSDARLQRKYKVLLEHERRANDLLEHAVAERTDELRRANEELRRTQAQLIHQEKMSSLGRLVAGIAHELNNPINFVYGNVDFLGRYVADLISLVDLCDEVDLPPDLRARLEGRKRDIEYDFLVEDSHKLLRSIRSGAERTAAIVRDLKIFSRAGGGALQEADLVEGLETTLNLVAPLFKNRIRIERKLGILPRVICHPGHIHQVFMNILTNAAQAIEGEGWVRVEAERVPGAAGKADRVRFAFTDSGPGVPEAIRDQIFDPFFTTKDPGEGTGLGLAISEGIAKSHGGTIDLLPAQPGCGATFVVELPLVPPPGERTERDARRG